MLNWFRKLIGRYDDYEECGTWGVFNVDTKESQIMGKMYSRTIKVEKEDGSVVLDNEWITDETMIQERETGIMDSPASPPNSQDPSTKADWWKQT
jgi:hypothetical protein